MLRSIKNLEGYGIGGTDGVLGHVKDLYFDDDTWTVRYFVADTGGWLSHRKVLIAPFPVGKPSASKRVLPVSLTREQVKDSPHIDPDEPLSRQREMEYLGYYGTPVYWGSKGYSDQPVPSAESKLRSCQAVMSFDVHASDGDIGHVQDMLVDDESWAIRYLVVNTSTWWLGHNVLIASQWIDSVSWLDAKVSVDVTRQAVNNSPPYIHAAPLERQQEAGLYDHYGRRSYWADHLKRDTEISRI
jgi:uncharacterized protein YrrD